MDTEDRAIAVPRWLTTKQVATQLQVNVRVIYHAVKCKRLRAAAIDGRGDLRFKQEWIDAWVDSRADPTELVAR